MSSTKLKAIRERHNLSQTQMGEILHLSQSAYQKLENGKSSLRIDQIVVIIQRFQEGAKDLLENNGIEITIKKNNINCGSMNCKGQMESNDNISSELLYEILEKMKEINNKLNL